MRTALLIASGLFATSLALLPAPAAAQDQEEPRAFAMVPLHEDALSELRGGFAIPGGLNVAVAVQSDTMVNGVLLLRSIFVVDKNVPSLAVFGRTDGVPGVAMTTTGAESAGASPTNTISFSNKAASLGDVPAGLTALDLTKDGAAVAASGGSVRVESAGLGTQVVLSQSTIDIRQLAGQAYGSVVLNRGNDVAVDTVTNINIDLRNATAFNLGSTMFRVEALAIDSATRLGR